MATIYVSLPSQIVKVLRREYAPKGGAIAIPPHVRVDRYWMKKGCTPGEARKKPSLLEMMMDAIRTEKEAGTFIQHQRVFCEEEYNKFPDSDEKKDELVALFVPQVWIRNGNPYVTNSKVMMEFKAGERFRRAMLYHFYDIFGSYLHALQHECIKDKREFNISEAIGEFADEYDLTTTEQDRLRLLYYRRKKF